MADDRVHSRRSAFEAGRLRRLNVIILAAVYALGALIVSLSGMEISRAPTVEAGRTNLQALWPWWVTYAVLWAALSLFWLRLRPNRPPRAGIEPGDGSGIDNTDPEESTRVGRARFYWRSAWLVLLVALAARVAVLFTHAPALSDDIYRYVFDGRNLASGVNPYLVEPAERADAEVQRWPGEHATAAQINNPKMHTIYLPASQWVFGGAGMLVRDAWSQPNAAATVFRGVFILFDMAVIAWILLVLRRAAQSPWWAALYAWHPLAITEIAGSGHQDVIGIALLLAALAMCETAHRRRRRGEWKWLVPLALSALVKPVTAAVGLILLRGRPLRTWLVGAATAAVVGLIVCGPLLLTSRAQPLANLRETAEQFAGKWAHFGSIYEPTLAVINAVDPIEDEHVDWRRKNWHEGMARVFCCVVVLGAVAAVLWRRRNVWTAARILLVVMVLASPTAHPWYLLWALALMPMAGMPGDACAGAAGSRRGGGSGGALTLWVLSLTLPWGYVVLGDPATWSTPPWVYAAAYAPVYGAALYELWSALRRRRLNQAAVS